MPALTLLLVRHGLTDYNLQRRYQGQRDIPLNEAGRRQAAALAARLAHVPVDAVYTSDLQRAHETARLLGAPHAWPLQADPRLRECGFGVMEGLTFDEAQARWFQEITAWLEDMDRPLPGGEKQSDFAARVADFLAAIRARHVDQTLLVVSHGGPIRELLRLALGMPPDGRWAFSIDNASLTELVFANDSARLQRLNDTCHLDNRG